MCTIASVCTKASTVRLSVLRAAATFHSAFSHVLRREWLATKPLWSLAVADKYGAIDVIRSSTSAATDATACMGVTGKKSVSMYRS